nr:MAG TPA: hypothetical protein [Caudoviricetes sp.]
MLKTITVSECKGNTYFLNTKQKSIKFVLSIKTSMVIRKRKDKTIL